MCWKTSRKVGIDNSMERETLNAYEMETSINCREWLEYEADGAQKPECTYGT